MKIWNISLKILEGLVFAFLVLFCIYVIKYDRRKAKEENMLPEEEFLLVTKQYEDLLDSTTLYIYRKYGEFLPDTYWKDNPVYTDIYEDLECWDRDYIKEK